MPTSKKLDLYKLRAAEYVAPKKPMLVKVGRAQYLTITGKGEPGGATFQAHVGALYGVAYTLKFAQKFAGRDYKVCNLEGLWWGSKPVGDFSKEAMSAWNWKLLIRVPDFINKKDVAAAVKQLREKGKGLEAEEVKLESITEGLCVQMLHVGPYEKESETIGEMREFAAAQGLAFHGLHHEIYLSDPRRVPATRLRTILRMPVR